MKKQIARLILISCTAIFCIILNTANVFACTCREIEPSTALEAAKVVFFGKVIAVKNVTVPVEGIKAQFRVEKVWKGSVSDNAAVLYDKTKTYCGNPNDYLGTLFEINKKYLVFARGKKQLITDVCALTSTGSEAIDAVKSLGRAKPPKSRRGQQSKAKSRKIPSNSQ